METLSGRLMEGSSTWTKEENKTFESALAMLDEASPERWLKVAAMIPTKSVLDVINQYRKLAADVSDIEAGLVPIPTYLSSSSPLQLPSQRIKGLPWTQAEHRRFLLGLEKHGKGDWKNISRKFVVTKTPTQVASHAQKYYMRQLNGGGKDKRRRPSIHDITVHLARSEPPFLHGDVTLFNSDLGVAYPYPESCIYS
ncbi:transcription factor DIVARICATA-like [Salvia miltiorrhiza]|uniref:transcription factor DIVARICATA-like n=1 Tax=Salvia miltiorrhiza TaxID=226208 RepID=UPI0025ABEC00|nr:transcription factor DIVARICATA-like [Salvia miltiorrhiza]